MLALILLIAIDSSTRSLNEYARIDYVQVDQIYQEDGSVKDYQLIFWRWTKWGFLCEGWQICGKREQIRRTREGWEVSWQEFGKIRTVKARFLQYTIRRAGSKDPEIENRKHYSETLRQGLVWLKDH